MVTVHLLGTGASVSDPHRTTTMLAVESDGRFFLVDCGGDAVQRLRAAGLDAAAVEAVVLTHQHPDHISGFALLIEKLWLYGRRDPIPIYGPADALRVARANFDAYRTDSWSQLPEREYHAVAMRTAEPVFERGPFHVVASPVEHPVPTIGLRVTVGDTVVAYSCDTAFCEAVVDLARDAHLLVHEANGTLPGIHSSAEEAAAVASAADVGRLVLVHLPPGTTEAGLVDARRAFPATEWGVEGGTYEVTPVAARA